MLFRSSRVGIDSLFGRFLLPDADPATSDVCFGLVGGKEPARRGQRNYHFLYREIMRVGRTAEIAELLTALVGEVVAIIPRLLQFSAYALEAGAVVGQGGATLLVGPDH